MIGVITRTQHGSPMDWANARATPCANERFAKGRVALDPDGMGTFSERGSVPARRGRSRIQGMDRPTDDRLPRIRDHQRRRDRKRARPRGPLAASKVPSRAFLGHSAALSKARAACRPTGDAPFSILGRCWATVPTHMRDTTGAEGTHGVLPHDRSPPAAGAYRLPPLSFVRLVM